MKNEKLRIFFDKRAQCQTRLNNAEQRKNARSELGGSHNQLQITKSPNPTKKKGLYNISCG